MDFFSKLFDTSDFPARWHCGNWTAGHGWLHILSDIGVWSAYFAIPAILIFLILRRTDLPFQRIFVLFGAFILFCGLTHLMEAIIFWWPAYRTAGLLKFLTAVISWTTVIALVRVGPRVMQMRSPEELEKEIEARKKAEDALLNTNAELERRVAQRTVDLAAANEILQAEREWFKTTLASIGDGVITTDEHGKVNSMNQVAEDLTGWNQSEAVNQPLTEIFQIINEQTREPVENPAIRALEEGAIVGLANHTILVARNGRERFIDDSAAPIRDQNQRTIGAVLIFRDISARYLAEQERLELAARLNMLVRNAPIGIAMFDKDLRYIDLNQRTATVDGVEIEEHIGRSPHDLLPMLGPAVEEHLREVLKTGEPVLNVEISGETPALSGEERYWIASYYPVRDSRDELLGIGSMTIEITDRKRSEKALEYQYKLTKTITDNATTAILMINKQGNCTFMNPAAERMIGYTFEEVQGKLLHDVIHHTRPDGSKYPLDECPFTRALQEHSEVQEHEDYLIHKDGELFPVICNTSPIYKASGPPEEAVIEVLDLTEQKLAAELLSQSERQFIQLADSIPQLAWIADPTGHINWYNTRWYEYTGTTFEEMQGWGWEKVHDPEFLPEVMKEWKDCLATGRPLDMVFPLRGADGVYRPFLTRVMPFRDEEGRISRWFGTNTDISEQQKIQEELSMLAARLSEADRRKDEFLATLAHELRNPLAPISTGLEVMKRAKGNPEILEQTRETMERQTQLLITLINDLLEVSRITQGKLELHKTPVPVAEFVQMAVESSQPLIESAGHELTVTLPEESLLIEADPHRMAQVISNLLNNAAKYTPEGGHIWLTAERENNQLLLKVKDTGIGIPEDMRERIFEMFAQIERPIEKGYTGLGIGLTLVRSLLEMHGGKIEVHSAGPDQGSEFQIRIPLKKTNMEQQEENETYSEKNGENTHRVLIVDDNQAAADMLGMVVKMLGHEIQAVYDGQEAIRTAAEFRPNIVLMDLGMPNMNGYEVARRMRAEEWGKDIYLVALTGWGQEEDKQQTKEAGFDMHLVKPADPEELERILNELSN